MTNEITSIDSVRGVDWETFRHDLAFSAVSVDINENDNKKAQEFLIKFCGILPKFYGEELDRMRMWERITTGLEVLASKLCDPEELADIMLKHICADVTTATADKELNALILEMVEIPVNSIKNVISKKKLFVVCKARTAWKDRFGAEFREDF